MLVSREMSSYGTSSISAIFSTVPDLPIGSTG